MIPRKSVTPVSASSGVRGLRPRSTSSASSFVFSTGSGTRIVFVLHFTGDAEANALLAEEPMALLIGFALDQQVTVPTAFSGPLKIKQRVGTLDAGELASLDPDALETAFRG